MPFLFKQLSLKGLIQIDFKRFDDDRGSFFETFKASDFAGAGISEIFMQDNHSISSKGVLRGLHFQRAPHAQGKLVRVIRGSAWDVAVDMRPESTTFRKWEALELSSSNSSMLYIPPGFAHGFLSLCEGTELVYKCTAEYHASSDGGIRWDDPALGIEWPTRDVILSRKDAELPFLDLKP